MTHPRECSYPGLNSDQTQHCLTQNPFSFPLGHTFLLENWYCIWGEKTKTHTFRRSCWGLPLFAPLLKWPFSTCSRARSRAGPREPLGPESKGLPQTTAYLGRQTLQRLPPELRVRGRWLTTEPFITTKLMLKDWTLSPAAISLERDVCTFWCLLCCVLAHAVSCSFIVLWDKTKSRARYFMHRAAALSNGQDVNMDTEGRTPFSNSLLGNNHSSTYKLYCERFPTSLNILWKHYFNGCIIIFPLKFL